jgi:hypothetical protein
VFKKIMLFVAMVMWAGLATVACDDGNDDPIDGGPAADTGTGDGGNDSSPAADSGNTPDGDTADGDTTDGDTTDGDTTDADTDGGTKAEEGNCTSPEDRAIHNNFGEDIGEVIGGCAMAGGMPSEAGFVACMREETGLSELCLECYWGSVECTMQRCLMQCMSNANSDRCMECQENNCLPTLFECTGLVQ